MSVNRPAGMTVPKDTHEADRVGMVRVARILSNVISPPVMFALAGLALGIYERPFRPGLAWGVVFGAFVALLPMIVILYLLRTGRVAELHMSDTGERHIPYLTGVIAGIAAYAFITFFDGPLLLRCAGLLSAVMLGTLGLINTQWLISIHATAAAATWTIITLVFGWVAGLILLPFMVLICLIRVYLKRHTVPQVLTGVGLGLAAVLLMRVFGCFTP